MKCAGVSYFSSQPSQAQLATLHKLTRFDVFLINFFSSVHIDYQQYNIWHGLSVFMFRERGELAEMLAKHKSLLTQCQQREFEAYMEVKKSAESAENVKLEKADVSGITLPSWPS